MILSQSIAIKCRTFQTDGVLCVTRYMFLNGFYEFITRILQVPIKEQVQIAEFKLHASGCW